MATETTTRLIEIRVTAERAIAELSKFDASLRKSGDQLTRTNDTLGKIGGALKGAFAGVLAGFSLGAVINQVNQAVDAMDALRDRANELGISLERLQEIEFGASLEGIEAPTLERALVRLSTLIDDVASGQKTAIDLFQKYGISARTATGEVASAEAVLAGIAKRMQEAASPTERLGIAVELFGRRGAAMVRLLKDGPKALDDMAQSAREAGVVLSQDLADRADELNDRLATATKAIQVDLAPTFLVLKEAMVLAAEAVASLAETWARAVDDLQPFIDAMSSLATDAMPVAVAAMRTMELGTTGMVKVLAASWDSVQNFASRVFAYEIPNALAKAELAFATFAKNSAQNINNMAAGVAGGVNAAIGAINAQISALGALGRAVGSVPTVSAPQIPTGGIEAEIEKQQVKIYELQVLEDRRQKQVAADAEKRAAEAAAAGAKAKAAAASFQDLARSLGRIETVTGGGGGGGRRGGGGGGGGIRRMADDAERAAEALRKATDELAKFEREGASELAQQQKLAGAAKTGEDALEAARAEVERERAVVVSLDRYRQLAEAAKLSSAAIVEGVGHMQEQTDAIAEARRQTEQYQDDWRLINSLIREGQTEAEKQAQLAREANEALGRLGDAVSPDQVEKVQKAVSKTKDTTDELGESMKTALIDSFDQMASAIASGNFTWQQFARAMIADLTQIIAKTVILDALMKSIGSQQQSQSTTSSSSGGSGGFLGMLFSLFGSAASSSATTTSARGNVFAGGNVVPFRTGGLIQRPIVFPMARGGIGLAGESGPEAIVPLRRINGNLGVASAAPVVNVHNYGGADVSVEQSRSATGEAQIDIMIQRGVERVIGQGRLDRSLRTQFGIRRTGGAA